ncbi:hypothetical protein [Chlamydia felis Fe/C-56]|uniref:Uncharacterized protein n=1 Tax=Chlamydia felis (strain Fe/C-56) TaxID=264202 RepID=Q254T5_CHLFF|nr:hypothetical protein [Chlamydia felis]BAE81203.1 hypothetical protein [Chlamydia felis Fe/C-56]
MSVSFFTPLGFSQQCLGEIAQAGQTVFLERLAGYLDMLFIQRSDGLKIKALGHNKRLLAERVKKVDSLVSLYLKVLLVLLIVPIIIALVLKIIVRLCLCIKYSGGIQEVQEVVVPIVEETDVVGEATVFPSRLLSREKIVEKFVTLPKLSEVQRDLLIKSIELLYSRGCATPKDYADRGILVRYMHTYTSPIIFELIGIPGITCTYCPDYLREENRGRNIVRSSDRAIFVCEERRDLTSKFLESRSITMDTTQEEVEELLKEKRKSEPLLGIFRVETFFIKGQPVGVLLAKKFD